MLSRSKLAKPRRQNAPRPAEKSARGFLQWLRGRECACQSDLCSGSMEAAHVDFAGGKGMGSKVADKFAIPMCSYHHRLQHGYGWETFQSLYRIDALKLAAAYWQAWPGRIAWTKKQEDGK